MHRLLTIALCLILTLNLSAEEKRAMMWFDATANFERFSHRDSISYYLQKIAAIGFTDVVVDIRPITGEVLYDSRHAPRMREWKGYVRPDFDYLAYFITTAHALGMKVHALRHLSSHRLSRPLAFVRGGNAQCGNAEMKALRFPQAWT